MNIVLLMLTGGFVGWVGYSFMGFNQARGMRVSLFIGAAGGFIGGKMVAPMFAAAEAVPADFSSPALFFAAVIAAAFLAAGNLAYNLWGV